MQAIRGVCYWEEEDLTHCGFRTVLKSENNNSSSDSDEKGGKNYQIEC